MTSNFFRYGLVIACCRLTLMPVVAQESPKVVVGFIRLFNAVCKGNGQLDCLVDGLSVSEKGYQLGNVTGGIELTAKSHLIEIRRDGLIKAKIEIALVAGKTVTLICFDEQIPASATQPAHWEIRVLKLNSFQPEIGRMITFVTVSKRAEIPLEILQMDQGWKTHPLTRLGLLRQEIQQQRGYLPIRCLGDELESISVTASGHSIAVLYDDEHGGIQMKSFIDYPYLGSE